MGTKCNDTAPIALFTYSRPFETERTILSLTANYLAKDSLLYVFSDGPKNDGAIEGVENTRHIISNITGFKNVAIFESNINKGLASSIINGVTQVLEEHGQVIVLEDDLITCPNFLDFMNQALAFYKTNEKVLSISGFTLPLKKMPENSDFYYGHRASSWAWGTWKRVWSDINWDASDADQVLANSEARGRFNRGGSDMSKMLFDQMKGRIDSWAIRFCYHQFKRDLVTVFPTKSKAASIGFGPNATHTFNESRFRTELDSECKRKFLFGNDVEVNDDLAKSFREFFSVRARLLDRLRRYSKVLFRTKST